MRRKAACFVLFLTCACGAYATDTSVPFIHADDVHGQSITGQGVTVAVVDAGIHYNHPGLAGSIAGGGTSFIDGVQVFDGGRNAPSAGHGTYMSLIITDPSGVAPGASILSIRVFAGPNDGLWGDIILGIQYAVLRAGSDPSLRVMNLSLGGGAYTCPCDIDNAVNVELASNIADALDAGIVTFAASGNEVECGGIVTPACVTDAVKVAASYDGNYGYLEFPGYCDEFNAVPYWVTCFSNISENCDLFLAAPGYDIQVGGFAGDGTSQATTHCSGAAALVFSKNKWLDAGYVRGLMWATATDMPWAFPDCPLPPHPRHLNALAAVNSVAPAPQAGVLEGPAAYNAAEGSVAMEGCGRFVIAYHQRLAPGRNNQVDALFNLYDVDGTPLDPLLPRIGGLIIT